MPTTTGTGRLGQGGLHPTMAGSGKAEWSLAHASGSTADTTYLNDPLNASVSANVYALPIPQGATRVILRAKAKIANYSFTTSPVVYVWTANGDKTVATRIDSTDQSGAGVTLTFDSTGTNNVKDSDATYYWSDIPSLTGYDCVGQSYLYVLVSTAADLNSSTEDVKIYALFLN